MNVLDVVQRETGYTYKPKGSAGKEYAGRCPFCQAGEDRFLVWPEENRYWCRRCERKGDAIQFLRDYKHLSFHQAKEVLGEASDGCDRTNHKNNNNHNNNNYHNNHNNDFDAPLPKESQTPPGAAWSDPAWQFVFTCQAHLMEHNTNERARAWLHGRKLEDATLWEYGIGYNPEDRYLERAAWGLPPATDDKGRAKRLWLPRGIVIPWLLDGELWGIRIRRPVGNPKYYWIPGGTPALYHADALTPDRPAVIVEGEIDALTIAQAVGDLAAAVATGSTHGGRRVRWLARLAATPAVLVAYDADDAGEAAARYWTAALPNARRWRPYWADPNDMARDGVDVRGWIMAGLQTVGIDPSAPEETETDAPSCAPDPLLQWLADRHPGPRLPAHLERTFKDSGEAWAYFEQTAGHARRLWFDSNTGLHRVTAII